MNTKLVALSVVVMMTASGALFAGCAKNTTEAPEAPVVEEVPMAVEEAVEAVEEATEEAVDAVDGAAEEAHEAIDGAVEEAHEEEAAH